MHCVPGIAHVQYLEDRQAVGTHLRSAATMHGVPVSCSSYHAPGRIWMHSSTSYVHWLVSLCSQPRTSELERSNSATGLDLHHTVAQIVQNNVKPPSWAGSETLVNGVHLPDYKRMTQPILLTAAELQGVLGRISSQDDLSSAYFSFTGSGMGIPNTVGPLGRGGENPSNFWTLDRSAVPAIA